MDANTFAGQVIAVLSRRTPALELDSADPQTFPGRMRTLLSPRIRADSASLTQAGGMTDLITREEDASAAEDREDPATSALASVALGVSGLDSTVNCYRSIGRAYFARVDRDVGFRQGLYLIPCPQASCYVSCTAFSNPSDSGTGRAAMAFTASICTSGPTILQIAARLRGKLYRIPGVEIRDTWGPGKRRRIAHLIE